MQRGTLRALFELLSSMRFAISLLTILSIASAIGTVIKQNDAFNAYLNQFGPFWFPVFDTLGLYSVYNAPWFVVILAFLVLSTSLCIVRQTVPMLHEMRRFREHAREASLRQFSHQASFAPALTGTAAVERAQAYLTRSGFRFRLDARTDGTLLAAKQGSAGRLGYFLAHGAIVLICIGGLLDGDLPLKLQMWIGDKQPTSGNQLIASIPDSARMPISNPSFRGNVFIPEGRSANTAVLAVGDNILLQELPFTVSLKKFHIDHYENGMPKRFASDILVTDNESGKHFEHTIEVNKPLDYHGITLYQSSFEDGGSILQLVGHSLLVGQPGKLLEFKTEVGESQPLKHPKFSSTLELTNFRAFNIEDMGAGSAAGAEATRGMARLQEHLGSGAKTTHEKDLRNLGPNYTFKLRDEAGQAREFQNYMLPIEQAGRWFMYSGTRNAQSEAFRYMRLPLDENGRLDTWFALHQTMFDPANRAEIAARFAARSFGLAAANAQMRDALAQTATHTLTLFADRGYQSVGRFLESTVAAGEQERAADVFVKILQGLAWESWALARERAGSPALELNPMRAQYLNDSLTALSDSLFYGAPVFLQLMSYDERQATVLQATRSPGQPLVFLGSLLLVLGVFAMLYIRERRLFVLLKPHEALVTLSSNRKAMDVDETFQRHVDGLRAALGSVVSEAPSATAAVTDPVRGS